MINNREEKIMSDIIYVCEEKAFKHKIMARWNENKDGAISNVFYKYVLTDILEDGSEDNIESKYYDNREDLIEEMLDICTGQFEDVLYEKAENLAEFMRKVNL